MKETINYRETHEQKDKLVSNSISIIGRTYLEISKSTKRVWRNNYEL